MSDKPINCEQALKQVFDYIDDELHAHDHAAMQAHLETCRSCFSRVEFERQLKRKLSGLRREEASDEVSEKIRSMLKTF